MIHSYFPLRERDCRFLVSLQERHVSDFEQIKLQIIDIVKVELSKDPNLTFSSAKVQVEDFIRFPKSNYILGPSLTVALEQAGITGQLNRILKVGSPTQLKDQWIQELHFSIAEIEHSKFQSKCLESKDAIKASILKEYRNEMGLSLLIKTLEKVFLKLKIDLCDVDVEEKQVNIDQYNRISEYNDELYQEILFKINKIDSENKSPSEKNVGLIEDICKEYMNLYSSTLAFSFCYVFSSILDWKSNFKNHAEKIVDVLIDSELSQIELARLMQQFSLNELILIKPFLIPKELTSVQSLSTLGPDEINLFFVQAIISKRCLKLWNTFSDEKRTQMIEDHMGSMIFSSVLFDGDNLGLCLTFLSDLTEPQCSLLYEKTPNRDMRIELLSRMPDKKKLYILKCFLEHVLFQYDFCDVTISGFPTDWQWDFFDQLTYNDQKQVFFQKLSYAAKQKILKNCDHVTLSQWIRDEIVSITDVDEFLFDDLCADDFKKFKDFDAEIQGRIFSCIRFNSKITSYQQLQALFATLSSENQLRYFRDLPLASKVEIWKTFPSDELSRLIERTDMLFLWLADPSVITFEENIEKFRNLDADFQLKIFQVIWEHLTPDQLSSLFQEADPHAKIEIFNSIQHGDWHHRSLKTHLFEMWLKMDSAARKHCFVDIIQSDEVREQFWAHISGTRGTISHGWVEYARFRYIVRVDLWIALSPAERVALIPRNQWVMESA